MKPTLTAELARLDALLPTRAPRVFAELSPPATPDRLAELSAAFGGTLPPELATWFGWHDGQEGSSAIAPRGNHTLHSIQSALATRAMLNAPNAASSWDPRWLPLLHNGAGDHIVYADGALVEFRHDDPARPVRWASLAQWAKQAAAGWSREKPRKIPLPGPIAWSPAEALPGWQAGVPLDQRSIAPPELRERFLAERAALAAMPPGTVLRYVPGLTKLAVKLAADRWLSCFGADLTEALAQWAEFSDKPPAARSGYYVSDEELWSNLSAYFRGAPRPELWVDSAGGSPVAAG